MMNKRPLIVICSPKIQAGKTCLALNLAAMLWSDNYNVGIFAPHNPTVQQFIEQRRQLENLCQYHLPMPNIITSVPTTDSLSADKSVLIADIPTSENLHYADLFAKAHTLISIIEPNDDAAPFPEEYLNLIWQAKKQAAAAGVKYLNWVVVANSQNTSAAQDYSEILKKYAGRYGYRPYTLTYRQSFQYINSGYCVADLLNKKLPIKMTLNDVYARRDILKLTDFLWKPK